MLPGSSESVNPRVSDARDSVCVHFELFRRLPDVLNIELSRASCACIIASNLKDGLRVHGQFIHVLCFWMVSIEPYYTLGWTSIALHVCGILQDHQFLRYCGCSFAYFSYRIYYSFLLLLAGLYGGMYQQDFKRQCTYNMGRSWNILVIVCWKARYISDGRPPYAEVELPPMTTGQPYDISLHLIVPAMQSNYELGNFMSTLIISTFDNETVASVRYTASYFCLYFSIICQLTE